VNPSLRGRRGLWRPRIRARQRLAWCMGNLLCMGLILCFRLSPSPGLNVADHGLAALVNVDMLDSDLLLALASMPVQRLEQRRDDGRVQFAIFYRSIGWTGCPGNAERGWTSTQLG